METLAEFRAGLLLPQERLLKPDPRKGLLRVAQDEHGLTHLLWFERGAGGTAQDEPKLDVVVFPGEAAFEKVPQPGARVFLLKFGEEPSRNAFFWAQEPSAERDAGDVAAVHAALNQEQPEDMVEESTPQQPAQPQQAAATASQPAASAAAPPQPAAAMAAPGGGASSIAASQLAAVLGNIMAAGGSAGVAGGARRQQQQRQQVEVGPTLGDVLKPELLAPLLQSPQILQRLGSHLPEEQRSGPAMAELVASPQFRHQLDVLSHALMTGQLDTSHFGLPPGGFGVVGLLSAIQQQAQQQAAQPQQKGGSAPAAAEGAQQPGGGGGGSGGAAGGQQGQS